MTHRIIKKPHHILRTSCWEWTRVKRPEEYGKQKIDGKIYNVHRISKCVFDGFDINSTLCVLHHCDNPPCFNPQHLFIGTKKDNAIDRNLKGRAHKLRGEQYNFVKLSNNKVKAIRNLRENGNTFEYIARKFHVHNSTIQRVCKRQIWSHILSIMLLFLSWSA